MLHGHGFLVETLQNPIFMLFFAGYAQNLNSTCMVLQSVAYCSFVFSGMGKNSNFQGQNSN